MGSSRFRCSERLVFLEELFLTVYSDESRRVPSVMMTAKFTVAWKTTAVEEKLLAISGYPELYDFINRNYRDLNKKQQALRQIIAALEILGRLLSSIVA